MGTGLTCAVSQSKKDETFSPPLKSWGFVLVSLGHRGNDWLAVSAKAADLKDGPRQMMASLILPESIIQSVNVRQSKCPDPHLPSPSVKQPVSTLAPTFFCFRFHCWHLNSFSLSSTACGREENKHIITWYYATIHQVITCRAHGSRVSTQAISGPSILFFINFLASPFTHATHWRVETVTHGAVFTWSLSLAGCHCIAFHHIPYKGWNKANPENSDNTLSLSLTLTHSLSVFLVWHLFLRIKRGEKS